MKRDYISVQNFLWLTHLSVIFLLGDNRSDVIFAVKKGQKLVSRDGLERGLHILGTSFKLAPK